MMIVVSLLPGRCAKQLFLQSACRPGWGVLENLQNLKGPLGRMIPKRNARRVEAD